MQRFTTSQALSSAPGLVLDHAEELRLNLTDRELISEAVAVNHAQIRDDRTLKEYERHLDHFAVYLASAHSANLYSARRKHVVMFLKHMEVRGGKSPDARRTPCEWCRERGYPDGRHGAGWSASVRKKAMAAIRLLYMHFAFEEDLPTRDPSAHVACPKVVVKQRFTPDREQIKQLQSASGQPRDRLLAFWMFYAPSRRQTFAEARWRDIDLEAGTWRIVGKNEKVDIFELHPLLIRELRNYRRWQLREAEANDAIRAALSDPETAFVLLTRTGRRVHPTSINKMIKRRAVRAGIAVQDGAGRDDAGGITSELCPHSLRRAWATMALNEEGVPLDVVAEVLNHADISTTRRHYAPTKPERARDALRGLRL